LYNLRLTDSPSQGIFYEKSPWEQHNSINNLDSRALEVLGCLFSTNEFKRESVSSLDYIASHLGCSRSTVQRSFNTIFAAGILTKKRRFNRSNVYKLSGQFNTPEFIEVLLKKIHNFYKSILFGLPLILSHYGIYLKFDQLIKNFNVLLRWVGNVVIGRRDYNFRKKVPPIPIPIPIQKKINTLNQKGVIMSFSAREVGYSARQEVIRQIDKKLPLTQTGAVNLQKYHVNALQEGLSRIKTILGKKEPYLYFLSVCESYSKENNLIVDRIENDRQKIKLGIPHYDKHYIDLTRVKDVVKLKPREAPKRRPEENGMSGRLPLFVPERIVDEKQVERWQKEVATMEAPNPFFAILQEGFKQKYAV
jgi:predicted transcriptional regulator